MQNKALKQLLLLSGIFFGVALVIFAFCYIYAANSTSENGAWGWLPVVYVGAPIALAGFVSLLMAAIGAANKRKLTINGKGYGIGSLLLLLVLLIILLFNIFRIIFRIY